MRKLLLLSVFVILFSLLAGCSAEEAYNPEPMTSEEMDYFNSYVHNITGRTFLKKATVNENQSNIIFVKDYDEHKLLNPESNITEKDYKLYWDTGDAINKVLMGESVRILKEFPKLVKINMIIPFEGKVYKLSIDRQTVEKYFSLKLNELNNDNQKWRDQFVNQYLYDKKERAKFTEKFITIE